MVGVHHRASRRAAASPAALLAFALLAPPGARAQLIDRYFASSVPSFDTQYGLTDMPQTQPGNAPPVHIAGFSILADLLESLGYDSNVDGFRNGPGSAFLETTPRLSAAAAGPRGRFGIDLTLDDVRYFTLPRQSRTDWTASLGLTYALGRDTLSLGYAHLAEHELATDLGAIASSHPIPFTSDDLRVLYAATLGHLTLTPNAEFTTFRFTGGGGASQTTNDRNIFTGGLTAAYALSGHTSLIAAAQDIVTSYTRQIPDTPSLDSNSILFLTGIETTLDGPWRYRLLAGLEHRDFAASAIPSITTPTAAASLTWQPDPRRAITLALSREIADAAAAGVGSYTYTAASLALDQTVRHDITVQLRADLQTAEYSAGGTQQSYGVGTTLVWIVSPHLQLRADFDHRNQGKVSGPVSGAVSSGFSQDRVIVSVRAAL